MASGARRGGGSRGGGFEFLGLRGRGGGELGGEQVQRTVLGDVAPGVQVTGGVGEVVVSSTFPLRAGGLGGLDHGVRGGSSTELARMGMCECECECEVSYGGGEEEGSR